METGMPRFRLVVDNSTDYYIRMRKEQEKNVIESSKAVMETHVFKSFKEDKKNGQPLGTSVWRDAQTGDPVSKAALLFIQSKRGLVPISRVEKLILGGNTHPEEAG